MTEKYIDLEDTLLQSCHKAHDYPFVMDVKIVLAWLDNHPDQVPGRTITESGVTEVFEASKSGRGGTRTALVRQGVTVIPDPEPTNAERATADLETWGMLRSGALELGPWLAGQGWVKAPEGESDE